METWEDLNYLTNQTRLWIEYLNISTTEWGLSPFPSNVVAIRGKLSDGNHGDIPEGAFVIQNAGEANIGERDIEKIVFGVVSGLAILMGLFWGIWTWKSEGSGGPGSSNNRSGDPRTSGWRSLSQRELPAGFFTLDRFDQEYKKFYRSEDDVYELQKTVPADKIPVSEIEQVIEYIRQYHQKNIKAWSNKNIASALGERNRLHAEMEVILAEARRVVRGWQQDGNIRWNENEKRQVQEIYRLLGIDEAEGQQNETP